MKDKSQKNESIFAMDSPATSKKKKRKVLYTVYPENKHVMSMSRRIMLDLILIKLQQES
jgi:hypothetical protein